MPKTASASTPAPAGQRIAERGTDGGFVFDARVVASGLGLSPEDLMAELARGTVFQVHEQGLGADAGRSRVTFRHRSRTCVLVLDAEGRLLDVG